MIKFFIRLLNHFEKKDKNYVSETDQFLKQFEHDHPKRSQSQLDEIAKHRNIYNRGNNLNAF